MSIFGDFISFLFYVSICINWKCVFLQGHIYVHDFRSTENTYAFFKLLPDGEYFFQALLFVKQDGKETLILKTKLFIDILAKGLIRF